MSESVLNKLKIETQDIKFKRKPEKLRENKWRRKKWNKFV